MIDDDETSEKGLFTFYREQAEEEETHKIGNKKRKSKKKNWRKNVENIIIQCVEMPELQDKSKLLEPEKHNFLKNVVGNRNKILHLSHLETSLPMRLSTQPNKQTLNLQKYLIQRKLQYKPQPKKIQHKKIFVIESQKKEVNLQKNLEQSNRKINDLHLKIEDQRIFRKPKGLEELSIPKIQTVKLIKGEKVNRSCKHQDKSFLEKVKFLERKSKSNLMSNRESARSSGRGDLHDENKKYFHQLIRNFYKHSENENNSAYKILKNALKFPTLPQKPKTRIKTQHISPPPRDNSKKIQTPIRSLSQKRDLLRSKFSCQKYSELYKKHIANQLRSSQSSYDCRTLNFIDMSKQYGEGAVESEERRRKKKIVKSRLGVQL